jgi:hypothetical protein
MVVAGTVKDIKGDETRTRKIRTGTDSVLDRKTEGDYLTRGINTLIETENRWGTCVTHGRKSDCVCKKERVKYV